MELFGIQNNRVILTPFALMIEPFKSIVEKDPSENKEEAILILSYVELLCSPRKSNTFAGYSELVRPAKVKKEVFGDENYQSPIYEPLEIIAAVEKYKQILVESSISYSLYVTSMNTIDKLKVFLDELDFQSTKLKPKEIMGALEQIPTLIRNLQVIKNAVESELTEAGKTRNAREIGAYEVPTRR